MENNFQNTPLIGLSHRGDSKNYIENSLEAFEAVVNMGFTHIETDLRMTLDHEVIAFHDENLKRLFNLDLKVEDLRFKEIDYLFKEKNCSLISLEEALIKFPNSFFNIDLKVQEVVKKSIETVRKMNAFHRVSFASFNSRNTNLVLKNVPEAIVSLGLKDVVFFKFFNVLRKKAKIIQIPLKWKGIKVLSQNVIENAKKKGLLVHVWTINDEKTIYELIDMGVNGIVTDEPELLMKILNKEN